MEKTESGFLLVDKPTGPTSHDVIDELRKITDIKKIGHAGTLDPFASGLLIVAVGRGATKRISQFAKLDKTYEAVLRLGAVSDTYDRTGMIRISRIAYRISKSKIQGIVRNFIGMQEQVPPMYSAKKVKGQRLYKLARQGVEIRREPVNIEIFNLKILSYEWPELELRIRCSSGTYIRSLAHDIGQALGCGAYLKALRRTAIGPYRLRKAVSPADLTRENWPQNVKDIMEKMSKFASVSL